MLCYVYITDVDSVYSILANLLLPAGPEVDFEFTTSII